MSFLEEFNSRDRSDLRQVAECRDADAIRRLLASEKIPEGPETFALLISPAAAGFIEEIAARAADLTARRHGKVIRFYAPLYVSNECTNTCTYCGFTMENKIERKTLGGSEMRAEAEHLSRRGFRHVLIVAGEQQKIVTPEYVASMVRETKGLFSSTSIELAPFRTQDYELLVRDGVDGLTVYQETYDREVYAKVHLRGKKRDFDWRLACAERGAEAKMRRISIGVLLGLAPDWKADVLACATHLEYLMKRWWRVQYSVSVPRLCSSETDYQPAVEVSDREVVQLIFAWRLAFPDAGINLSTREPAYLRDGLIGLGVTHMSAESATEPGGYCSPEAALKQFDITDERKLDEIAAIVKAKGCEPVYKDWEPCLIG